MLEIKNLHASIAGKEILKGLNLTINEGEVHAIMGPNGAGKSTLSNVLTGHPAYTVTEGEVIFRGKNLLEMSPEVRAREGIFLSFQYPVEIPGVSIVNFMRTAVNEKRQHEGLEPLKATEFLKLMREKKALVGTQFLRLLSTQWTAESCTATKKVLTHILTLVGTATKKTPINMYMHLVQHSKFLRRKYRTG